VPGTNLTRSEAAQRSATVATKSYDVHLDLTRGDATFGCRTIVRFDAVPGSATFLDLIAPAVHSVRLNDIDLDPSEVFVDSRIHLDQLEASNVVEVVAECAYMTTGEGLHRFVDPVDGEVYLYTQFEVADARRVYPVFEQPDLKASFKLNVIAPPHWTVVSNSPTPEPVDDGEAATWSFDPTPRLPSYITALIAGPYHRVDGELTSIDGRTIPLGVFCRASLAEFLDADNILAITRAGFAFFEEQFAVPYPFAKYDQLFVPEFNAGAMENAGAVTFLEDYVFRSKVSEAMRERRTLTILHELAHMWFGNLVTMVWWDDLWLNESFAEFMSTLATAATAYPSAWTTFSLMEKTWAYDQDQLPTTHPIVADMRDLADVEVNFDGITYAKGASVLRQLVAWVGQDNFMAGVRAYFAEHAWGNTRLSDFLHALENASGRDLSEWSRLWLQTCGVNLLRPEITTDDNGVVQSFTIHQEASREHPILRPHRLVVGGYDLTGTELQRTVRIELDVAGEHTAVPELVGVKRPDLILINDEDLAYARIRLDGASLITAVANLACFTNSLPRTLVWGSAWDMVRDGELGGRIFVDLVLGNILAETDSSVVLMLLRQLAATLDRYIAPEHRGDTATEAADRLGELAWAATPGSDIQLQLVRAFAQRARTTSQLSKVADLLNGTQVLDGLLVDTDLRWDLVTALVAGGCAQADLIETELRRDSTASGQRAAVLARAAEPSPAAKQAAWNAAVVGNTLTNALQQATLTGFSRTHDTSLLAPFVEPYFACLEKVWATKTNELAQNVVLLAYPANLASKELVDGATGWLDSHPDAAPALRRLIIEHRDATCRALTAQAGDLANNAPDF
jgi:aminopeptidase N